jgi:ketosteroid isomerase-like protein
VLRASDAAHHWQPASTRANLSDAGSAATGAFGKSTERKKGDAMGARTPEDLDRLFARALNSADLDAMVGLYEPGATLRPAPAEVVEGHAAIRAALSGFLQMKPTIELSPSVLGQCGDLALITARWTLDGTGPDGKPVQMTGNSIEVARRQSDGTWLFAIDTPSGLESTA